MANFDPVSSDMSDVYVMGARFDGLVAYIEVMGGQGFMVDREGLTRPVQNLMATLTLHFEEPEKGAQAVEIAKIWMENDDPVRIQTFSNGTVKVSDGAGSVVQTDCLTP